MTKTNIEFTQDELKLIEAALTSYGNKLAEMAKTLLREPEIEDMLADRAKESWNLASKINN